jgi:hypothetical protein
MIEDSFNGILSGAIDADLIVLSVSSVFVGLSCIEKYQNIRAISIYTLFLSCEPVNLSCLALAVTVRVYSAGSIY